MASLIYGTRYNHNHTQHNHICNYSNNNMNNNIIYNNNSTTNNNKFLENNYKKLIKTKIITNINNSSYNNSD